MSFVCCCAQAFRNAVTKRITNFIRFNGISRKILFFYSPTVNASLFLLNISTKYLAKTKLSIYEGSFRIILSVVLQM